MNERPRPVSRTFPVARLGRDTTDRRRVARALDVRLAAADSGTVKIAYDLMLLFLYRDVPEEIGAARVRRKES